MFVGRRRGISSRRCWWPRSVRGGLVAMEREGKGRDKPSPRSEPTCPRPTSTSSPNPACLSRDSSSRLPILKTPGLPAARPRRSEMDRGILEISFCDEIQRVRPRPVAKMVSEALGSTVSISSTRIAATVSVPPVPPRCGGICPLIRPPVTAWR